MNELRHFGIKGMHWGITRNTPSDTSNGISKSDEKIIKKRKNELLNRVVSSEMEIESAVDKKMSISHDEALLSNDIGKTRAYLSEKAQRCNEYIKNNPSILPKDTTITYDAKKASMDDLTLNPEYTYKGKPVSFVFGTNSENDRVFLDESPEVRHGDSLQHYGVPGMRWGIRRSRSLHFSPQIEKQFKKKNDTSVEKLKAAKTSSDHASKITEEGLKIHDAIRGAKAARRREDLSQLSDAELKAKITRMNLEQQYNNLNSNQVSKGQAYARSTLEIAGSVLAIGSSAVGIALSVKQLKGG